MEKLTLNELAPYLPYGVMVTKENWDNILRVTVEPTEQYDISINDVLVLQPKLILKPLLDPNAGVFEEVQKYSYGAVQELLSAHYDVFGLIPRGLAEDINFFENGTEEDNSEQGKHNQTPDREGTGDGWEIHDRHPR
jgi:hypothetical protein